MSNNLAPREGVSKLKFQPNKGTAGLTGYQTMGTAGSATTSANGNSKMQHALSLHLNNLVQRTQKNLNIGVSGIGVFTQISPGQSTLLQNGIGFSSSVKNKRLDSIVGDVTDPALGTYHELRSTSSKNLKQTQAQNNLIMHYGHQRPSTSAGQGPAMAYGKQSTGGGLTQFREDGGGGGAAANYEAERQAIIQAANRSRSSGQQYNNSNNISVAHIRPSQMNMGADNLAQHSDLVELDQRHRIFEDVIIQRIKVVQDFVKQKYSKLSSQLRDCRNNKSFANRTDRMEVDDLHRKESTVKGSIIEIVESAMKWRLEANNKKQLEVMEELAEKVRKNKHLVDMVASDNNAELLEVKNQIVEAVADVLQQVQDNLMPSYERQIIDQLNAQLFQPYQLEIQRTIDELKSEIRGTQDTISKQDRSTMQKIQVEIKADKDARARLKSTKPIDQRVQQRFDGLQSTQQDAMEAQEQITEEMNKFQSSCEKMLQRIELLESGAKDQSQVKKIGNRVQTLEFDQREAISNSNDHTNAQLKTFESQMRSLERTIDNKLALERKDRQKAVNEVRLGLPREVQNQQSLKDFISELIESSNGRQQKNNQPSSQQLSALEKRIEKQQTDLQKQLEAVKIDKNGPIEELRRKQHLCSGQTEKLQFQLTELEAEMKRKIDEISRTKTIVTQAPVQPMMKSLNDQNSNWKQSTPDVAKRNVVNQQSSADQNKQSVLRSVAPTKVDDMQDMSEQTLKSAPPPIGDPVSSPDIASRQSISMKGKSEWFVVGQTMNKKTAAAVGQSFTSSYSHGQSIAEDGMVRGSLKRIEGDDPYSGVRNSLKQQRSPDPFKANALKDPLTSNKASFRIMEVQEVMSEEESFKASNQKVVGNQPQKLPSSKQQTIELASKEAEPKVQVGEWGNLSQLDAMESSQVDGSDDYGKDSFKEIDDDFENDPVVGGLNDVKKGKSGKGDLFGGRDNLRQGVSSGFNFKDLLNSGDQCSEDSDLNSRVSNPLYDNGFAQTSDLKALWQPGFGRKKVVANVEALIDALLERESALLIDQNQIEGMDMGREMEMDMGIDMEMEMGLQKGMKMGREMDMDLDMDMDMHMDLDEDGGLEQMVEGLEDLADSGKGFHFEAVAMKSKSKKRPGLGLGIGGLDLNSVQPLGNLGSSSGFKSRASASYGQKIGFTDDYDLDQLEQKLNKHDDSQIDEDLDDWEDDYDLL